MSMQHVQYMLLFLVLAVNSVSYFTKLHVFLLKLLVFMIQQIVVSLARTMASFSGLHSDNSYQAFAAFTAFTSVIDAAC